MLKHLRHSLVFAMTLLAPLLFGAAPARSDNQTTVGSLTLTANYNTIQFKLAYTGDDDQDATVLVRYWKTSSSANKDTAVVPVRDVTEPRFTGVIFWLDESTGYTVEAKISDPDGLDDLPNPSTITESITTRHSATPSVTGNTIWVSPSGNNNNPGTSSGSPKQTIAAALSALSGAGSQIRLLPGIYYETFQPMVSGNSSNYYSIVGDSNPDSTIIDGSDVNLLNTNNWLTYPPGGSQLNSIYYRIYSNASTIVKQVTAGWGQRLHRKECPRELLYFTECNSPYASALYPQQGYRVSGDTLFVRLESGADPESTTMHVSIRPTIAIYGEFWMARNLTARYSQEDGIFIGTGYNGGIVRGCRTYNNRGAGVFVNNGADSALVDSCTIWDGRVDSWSYLSSKVRDEEKVLAIYSHGHNTVVKSNTVTGMANGITVAADASMDKTWGADSDVYYNKVTSITDDGLEFDYNQGVNVAVWGNIVRGANFGWSQTTSDIGPIYVMYNVFDSMDQAGIKLGATAGSGDSAYVYYYHNIFTSASPFIAVKELGEHKNQVFCNNILGAMSPGYIVEAGFIGALLDYDLNWRVADKEDDDVWSLVVPVPFSTIQAWGYEVHGVNLEPCYADSGAGNFRPCASNSNQVDKGIRIQGINTPHKTRGGTYMYSSKPDVGAYEYNFSNPAQPPFRLTPMSREPRAEAEPIQVQFALGDPQPNPMGAMTMFQLTLGRATRVDAGIFDVSGRLVRTIAAGTRYPAGTNWLSWDGRDHRGLTARSGLYFLRVEAVPYRAVRRVAVLH